MFGEMTDEWVDTKAQVRKRVGREGDDEWRGFVGFGPFAQNLWEVQGVLENRDSRGNDTNISDRVEARREKFLRLLGSSSLSEGAEKE